MYTKGVHTKGVYTPYYVTPSARNITGILLFYWNFTFNLHGNGKLNTSSHSIMYADFSNIVHQKWPTELAMKKCSRRKCFHTFWLAIFQIWCKKNKHKIYYNFLLRNLWKPKIMNNLPGFFFFCGGCVLLGMDGKVKKRSNEHSLTIESAFFS